MRLCRVGRRSRIVLPLFLPMMMRCLIRCKGRQGRLKGFRGQQRGLEGVCPKLSSKSFVPISEVRVITILKVRDNVGSSSCMRARMSESFSDVFMTMTSFTDVLSFLSDKYRIDSTAWHMKMWVQLWFENIYDKELCYTLYRCTP